MLYGLRGNSSALKILALQLRARRERLYIHIPGRFAQKNTRDAETVFSGVKEGAARAAERFGWKPVPRARLAVEMHFFAEHAEIPAVHHLVKGYLDPLEGPVFRNDRQVAHLVAACWKPPAPYGDKGREHENTVYITVERWADCVRRFDLWQELSEHPQFRLAGRDDETDDPRYRVPGDFANTERMLDSLGIEGEPREQWRRLQRIEFQNGLLAGAHITRFDRPGGAPKPLAQVAHFWKRQAHPLLFSLDLRGLPARGESKEFRTHVREQVRAVGERWGPWGRFIVPVELDIQVPDEPGVRPTDLDNIVRAYIAPALAGELLQEPDGYIHGYRIYRVRRAAGDRAIGVRIMPEGAIQRFEESVDKTLEAGREWLEDALRGY
jgi:hypothetical protein